MPGIRNLPHDLRRHALDKIAALSASSARDQARSSDFVKLCDVVSPSFSTLKLQNSGQDVPPSTKIPLTVSELEVLLALCKAAPSLADVTIAKSLLDQLGLCLIDTHVQAIAISPFVRSIEPSPWELLSFSLAYAIIALGLKHPAFHLQVFECTCHYLQECLEVIRAAPAGGVGDESEDLVKTIGVDQAIKIAALSTSLLGFLDAASRLNHFFSVPERRHLVELLRNILTEQFMITVEGVFSSMRTAETPLNDILLWRYFTRRYAASGRPLGAMLLQQGFLKLLVSCSSLEVADEESLQRSDTLDILLLQQKSLDIRQNPEHIALLELLSDIAIDEMHLLEDGADYLRLASSWQQRLAFSVKARTLTTYLNCMIANEEVADADVLVPWLEETIADAVQMSHEELASVTLRSMAVVSRFSPSFATSFSRLLPRFIVQSTVTGKTIDAAARSLAYTLQLLSQDAVITGLYSLGNVLSNSNTDHAVGVPAKDGLLNLPRNAGRYHPHANGSAISLDVKCDDDAAAAYGNIVRAIVGVANSCDDDKITALALSILLQKLGRVNFAVDNHIIREAARLVVRGGPVELKSLLKLYGRISHDCMVQRNSTMLEAVKRARTFLAKNLHDATLLEEYKKSLLETILSKGDVHESDNTHEADVELAAREITELLAPLAVSVSCQKPLSDSEAHEDIPRLQREAWFNIVVHGITPYASIDQQFISALRSLAVNTKPLIAHDRADQYESEIELNTVLRRGMNPPHTAEQKKRLISLLPKCEPEIRSLSYSKLMFLHAAYVVETLRAEAGDCTKVLSYFLDPSLNNSAMGNCMVAISDEVMKSFLRCQGEFPSTVAEQLAQILTGCCHRIRRVQIVAFSCAEKLISTMPSCLCQRKSLFALLELLSMMWTSCLDCEIDEYDWKSGYFSERGEVSIELSDDFELRKSTLNYFYKRAKEWVTSVINIAPLDVKGLLQTYLSEYDSDSAYGHISLGRSFALEMGSVIPSTDQKLVAIDRHGDCNINSASDFVAQYTTRQEYRHADTLPDHDPEWSRLLQSDDDHELSSNSQSRDKYGLAAIARLESRSIKKKFISAGELQDTLRRAAAVLCKSQDDQCAVVRYLVSVPFTILTKQSIKLGISLWLGVINENPRMEARIFSEIVANWENTIRNRVGAFSSKFNHLDPFFLEEEFAPSDKKSLLKRQQAAQNLVAPHLRILQFVASHFSATRLESPHTQRILQRLVMISLAGLKDTTGHPLAREMHFQVILFGLTVLRFSSNLDLTTKWRLKDAILSSALRWFSRQPRLSFGGNRLQIKAESRLMADVRSTLQAVPSPEVRAFGSALIMTAKQDLLSLLLENESMRLTVWLHPLDHERRHIFVPSTSGNPIEARLSTAIAVAWAENPSLAVQLTARFQSLALTNDVRKLLLQHPERAIGEQDALQILLGPSLPTDVSSQLKYLLYWKPVNPITAATYFLPEYGNHPFLLQYAMRTLESHPVDVTFFYVPQIVQALRYDALGYVQRYIIETAKFSQLFAHQIIWNMKANAYRDEDSTVEDSLKPMLDVVMDNMVANFSGTDKAFYHREFTFFDQITDISGKLRPFIKESKSEKKQKIEEELRKIKVETGVYLPSNPDGIVIGIDRKSGKPLQSHAKAPYMATFRIRKTRRDMEGGENTREMTNQNLVTGRGDEFHETTYEIWQSAIFKVGDDCRQDVLALQMIAAFRGIFNSVGLDVYVYPYRVTATAPGCGVIDVLPNSISRDMLGREAVNGLFDYFVSKYGAESSVRFQEARNNFVKSMAAYSVISYLLQFKDRHNGNIMVDDAGHILHVDFGFCFDIAPGGVRFERAPFKLTSEMIAVMGGSTTSQSFRWFEELCIKSFLASRQHSEKLCHIVVLMLGSGLPCFKPETISHLRERFVLEKSDREAASFMRDLIKKSYGSLSTKGYDQFQLLTNGIPY